MLQLNGNMTVDGIDFYVTDTFGEELYNSCKEVKFGTMNTRAIDFIGAGARNFKGDILSFKECNEYNHHLNLVCSY